MNCLYMCSTPLQILNAINIHHNRVLLGIDFSTMVIVQAFSKAEEIANAIRNSCLFSEVLLIDKEDRLSQKNGISKLFKLAYDVLCPRRLIKQQFHIQNTKALSNKYDYIVSSYFSHTIASLRTINPKSQYIMIDDGLASYFGNWTERLRSHGYLRLLQIRNMGRDISSPKALYLLQPALCSSTITTNIKMLPLMQPSFLKVAFDIFNIPHSISGYAQKIVWLSLVSNNLEKKEGTLKIADILEEHKEDVLIRLHPREIRQDVYKRFSVDENNYMWEVQVGMTAIEEKLLITQGSTAVFTPKLMYNKEPYILFTYKLIPLPNNTTTQEFQSLVTKLKKLYNYPERIYEPETWKDFKTSIDLFLLNH